MSGVTNHTIDIVNFFDKKEKKVLKKFIDVFPSNFIIRFINFHTIMKENNNLGYCFLIMNTDRAGKKRPTLVEFSRYPFKKGIFFI